MKTYYIVYVLMGNVQGVNTALGVFKRLEDAEHECQLFPTLRWIVAQELQ
jgi:hypothetical protein